MEVEVVVEGEAVDSPFHFVLLSPLPPLESSSSLLLFPVPVFPVPVLVCGAEAGVGAWVGAAMGAGTAGMEAGLVLEA